MVVLPACSSDDVWGLDPAELAARLARGDHEPLRHVSFDEGEAGEVALLGADAAFAVGLIFTDLGAIDAGERLLRIPATDPSHPFHSDALVALVDLYHGADRHADLAALLEPAVSSWTGSTSAPGSPESRLVRAYLAALAELDRFEELSTRLSGLSPETVDPGSPGALDLAFLRSLTALELDREGRHDDVRRLYRDYPAGAPHVSMLRELAARPLLLDGFTPSEIDFFEAKRHLAEGRPREAVDLLAAIADARPDGGIDLLTSPWGLLEFYRAGARSGRLTATADRFVALADGAPVDVARRALEYAGRLFRLTGAYDPAERLLERSLALQPPGADEQRIRWYLLSVTVRRSPTRAAERLSTFVPWLADPTYFADTLAELASLLAQRGRWDLMLEAYEAIDGFAPRGTLARYETTIARALATGRLAAAPARAEEVRATLLERAAAQRENPHAALLAATLLGRDGVEQLGIAGADTQPIVEEDRAAAADETREGRLAATYLRYGLFDRFVAVARSGGANVAPGIRLEAARRLAEAGRIRESVLVLTALEASGGALTREAAELRYPRAFAAIIDSRVARESIDPATFYALIREESLFDPEIGSVAGAIGLGQLMQSTADDIARRMRLEDPVLTDPADNISIGARYFSMLGDQFGTPARAIAAYNGGQGNLRRWERERPGADEILFHEAIPFDETYHHVRKVVVSASYYGYLYDGRAPAETIRLIFNLRE